MNIASFIAGRIVFQKGQSFSRFIIRLSTAATVISVAVMILALAFVAGFQQTISNKVFSFWGHIRIQEQEPVAAGVAEELPSYRNDTVARVLQQASGIRSVDVYATKSALLKSTESIEGILLKGVEPAFHKERLTPFITAGQWLQFDTTGGNYPILISEYTAKQLQLQPGSKAYLYFLDQEGALPRIRPVTVSGIYKTAIEEYDKTFVLTDLRLIQRINNWTPNQIGGYEVTLTDYRDDFATSNRLLDQIPTSWYSTAVRELYPNIFDWLQLQNINRQIIIVIMCVVAIINLVTCLLILVLERSRMIGLLKATGATNGQVQSIFWQQGLVITITGIVLGNVLGLGLCWLQQTTGFIRLNEAAYYMSRAPILVIWWQVLLVNLGTFFVSFLVLLIPALVVRSVSPVKALRFE